MNSGGNILSGSVVEKNSGWCVSVFWIVLLMVCVIGEFFGNCWLCFVSVDCVLDVVLLLIYLVVLSSLWYCVICVWVSMLGM